MPENNLTDAVFSRENQTRQGEVRTWKWAPWAVRQGHLAVRRGHRPVRQSPAQCAIPHSSSQQRTLAQGDITPKTSAVRRGLQAFSAMTKGVLQQRAKVRTDPWRQRNAWVDAPGVLAQCARPHVGPSAVRRAFDPLCPVRQGLVAVRQEPGARRSAPGPSGPCRAHWYIFLRD